jgi:membrane protease YdiL (CAAX protease family)
MTAEQATNEKGIGFWKYALGLLLILFGAYSQYIFNIRGLLYGTIVVYILPSIVVLAIDGRRILAKAGANFKKAIRYGFGYFGIFSSAGFGLAFLLLAVLFAFDPKIMDLLNRPNPLLEVSSNLAWIMVLFSFVVVGPFEEFLFRGYIFGELLDVLKNKHWIISALISSIIFSIIHLYYVIIFGIVSIIQLSQIVMFGLGMSGAYYKSRGNLVIPALIHGAFDATSYLIIAIPNNIFIGIGLKFGLILVSVFVGVFAVLGKKPSDSSGAP